MKPQFASHFLIQTASDVSEFVAGVLALQTETTRGILTHMPLNSNSIENRSSGSCTDQNVVSGTKRPLIDLEETGDPTTSLASLESLFRGFGLYLSLPSDEGAAGTSVCLVFSQCNCVRKFVCI